MYTIFLCLGPIVGGIVGGYTGFELGWAYNFWIATALSGACFVGVFAFIPETLYDRVPPPGEPQVTEGSPKEAQATHAEKPATPPITDYRPYTFARSLGFRATTGSLLHHFIQPWRTLALPGTWVVMLHYAGLVGGIVTISTVGAQIVQQPPYLWGANAGLINIGGIIGAILGYLYTHVLSDRNLTRRARHDVMGLAEAEDRLPTMFLPLAIATCGFFVFGFCAEYPGTNRWVGLEVGYGMLAFGLMQVPSIGFNYVSSPPFPRVDLYAACTDDATPAHRLVRTPRGRLLRHGHHPPRHHLLRLDLFRVSLGGGPRSGGAVWHLWHAHGHLLAADRPAVAVWEANEDRAGWIQGLGGIGGDLGCPRTLWLNWQL